MNKKLIFEQISDKLSKQPALSKNLIGVLMERCITRCCLQGKQSGSLLNKYEDTRNLYTEPYLLEWDTEFTEKLKKTHQDVNKTTEDAAVFLSLSLVLELTEYKYFEVSEGNNGIDYWLRKGSDELEFSARLEISGINKKKQTNNIKTRTNSKIKQTELSDKSNLPAYISIVEFSELEALIFEK